MDDRRCPVSWSDTRDTSVESERDTLRFQSAQTKRAANPKPFPDAVLPVAVVVVVSRFNGNEAASSANVRDNRVIGPRFARPSRVLPCSAVFMLSYVSKRGLSSWATALRSNALIDIHPEVAEALRVREPVVALESTIITHGMPYPVNLETAKSVEQNVRVSGSIPATIGLIEGRIKIGLEPHELERLAECRKNPVKLSRRDIGAAVALKRDGGTTCSATLVFAALAGIKVWFNSCLRQVSESEFSRSLQREGTLFTSIEMYV